MLTFPVQEKIFAQLLKKPTNQLCADCDTKSPTWVSLDFGVFLCSNCSGAHRALGPTITRVRSTKLDKWQEAWLDNMQIGNTVINKYWEAQNSYMLDKPKPGASLQQINRYVVQKYIKKKYAKEGKHPLQAYKDGQLVLQTVNNTQTENAKKAPINMGVKLNQNNVQQAKPQVQEVKKQKFSGNLLDDDDQPIALNNGVQQHHLNNENSTNNHFQPQTYHNTHTNHVQKDDQDQFTEYTEGCHVVQNGHNHQTHHQNNSYQQKHTEVPAQLSFDDLIKKHSNNSSSSSPGTFGYNSHTNVGLHQVNNAHSQFHSSPSNGYPNNFHMNTHSSMSHQVQNQYHNTQQQNGNFPIHHLGGGSHHHPNFGNNYMNGNNNWQNGHHGQQQNNIYVQQNYNTPIHSNNNQFNHFSHIQSQQTNLPTNWTL